MCTFHGYMVRHQEALAIVIPTSHAVRLAPPQSTADHRQRGEVRCEPEPRAWVTITLSFSGDYLHLQNGGRVDLETLFLLSPKHRESRCRL